MVGNTRQNRAKTAHEILDLTSESLPKLRRFLQYDRSALLAGISLTENQRDPRMICLNNQGRCTSPDLLFIRLLGIRFLASCYEDWLGQKHGLDTGLGAWLRASRPNQLQAFIRQTGLPDTWAARGWLKCGRRLLKIERETHVGVSLAMMFVFPKFPHFDNREVEKAIHLLNQGLYSIMQETESMKGEFMVYIEQYREQMRLLSTQVEAAQPPSARTSTASQPSGLPASPACPEHSETLWGPDNN